MNATRCTRLAARAFAPLALLAIAACAPRLTPLTGVPAPAERMPRSTIPAGHHRIVFDWQLGDRDINARGEGAARIASPDSARLDFFLAGGFGGGGGAILIGDSLQTPPGAPDFARRLIPPPALLWAALGRVAFPNLPDTIIRIDGATLRADIGQPVAWRLSFRGDTLVRAERVTSGRVAEWVQRTDATHVEYRNTSARRSLRLTLTRTDEVPDFDASTWRFDR
jgi:hypothetical protein